MKINTVAHIVSGLFAFSAMVGGVNSSDSEWYRDDSLCNKEGTIDDKGSRDESEAKTTVM